jgi:hypothetical protein
MGKIEQLLERARALPKPYRTRAIFNIRDARYDLARWPDHRVSIIADCERAIEQHEQDAQAEKGAGMSKEICTAVNIEENTDAHSK